MNAALVLGFQNVCHKFLLYCVPLVVCTMLICAESSSSVCSVCLARRWHCGQSLCAGTCVATGDPHYVTFDGRCYSFLGDCEYVLAQETSGLFSVTAENVPCGSTGVTCTKSVAFTVGNTAIHMLRGEEIAHTIKHFTLQQGFSNCFRLGTPCGTEDFPRTPHNPNTNLTSTSTYSLLCKMLKLFHRPPGNSGTADAWGSSDPTLRTNALQHYVLYTAVYTISTTIHILQSKHRTYHKGLSISV